MRVKLSITAKFLILNILIVIIAIASLGLRTISITKNVIYESSQITMENQADTVARLIEDVIDQEFNLLDGLANIPDIVDYNVSLEEKTELLGHIKNMNPGKYNNIGYCDINGLSLVGPGRVMDFSSRDLYLLAKSGKRYVSEPSESTFMPGLWLMYYSVPVLNDGKFAGAALSVIEGNDLDKIVAGIDMGEGSHPIVIDRRTGVTIGQADRGDKESNNQNEVDFNSGYGKAVKAALEGKTDFVTYIDEATGKEMFVSFRPIQNDTALWSVFCQVPADYYLSGLNNIRFVTIFTLVIAILASIILSIIIIRIITKPIKNVSSSMEEISKGNADLSKRIEKTTNDEVGSLVEGFNSFTSKMQNIMKGIQQTNEKLALVGDSLDESTLETENSIKEIIENIDDVHKQIEIQSSSVHGTAGAVNEIASNIESLERMIQKQADGVMEASNAVGQMIDNINSVNDFVDKMAVSFSELTESTHEGALIQNKVNENIEEILNQSVTLQEANIAIASIANQTNLLAMNAAIEAAHAGDAGKGFSVVADEIRKLSETSSVQSKTIGEQLNNIQSSIQNVVSACGNSSQAFETIRNKIGVTDEIVQHIKSAMEEQTEGSRQINTTLNLMTDSTEEVRVASQEMALGNKAILEEVSVLQDATGLIKNSMDVVNSNANRITKTGESLAEISNKMQNSISEIGEQIGQFKV